MFGFEGTNLHIKAKERRYAIGIGFRCIYASVVFLFLDSSMVEHSAVNRVVVGSSPTRGVRRR